MTKIVVVADRVRTTHTGSADEVIRSVVAAVTAGQGATVRSRSEIETELERCREAVNKDSFAAGIVWDTQ